MKIYSVVKPHSELFEVKVIFAGGSFADPASLHGLAHVTEHVLFTQLSKQLQKLDLFYVVESVTATTYRDFILLGFTILDTDLRYLDDIVHSLSSLDNALVATFHEELQILLRELKDEELDPMFNLYSQESQFLYGDSQLAQRNGGTSSTILNINWKDVEVFHSRMVEDSACIALVVGPSAIDGAKQDGWKPLLLSNPELEIQPGPRLLEVALPFGEPEVHHIYFGKVENYHEKVGMSILMSALERELREEVIMRGLSYFYEVNAEQFGENAQISLWLSVDVDKLDAAQILLKEIVKKVCSASYLENSLQLADIEKEYRMRMADTDTWANNYAIALVRWGVSPSEFIMEMGKMHAYPVKDLGLIIEKFGFLGSAAVEVVRA